MTVYLCIFQGGGEKTLCLIYVTPYTALRHHSTAKTQQAAILLLPVYMIYYHLLFGLRCCNLMRIFLALNSRGKKRGGEANNLKHGRGKKNWKNTFMLNSSGLSPKLN